MSITKKQCVEFLDGGLVDDEKVPRIYDLYMLTQKFDNKWPDKETLCKHKDYVFCVVMSGGKALEINLLTRADFGRMVSAKEDVKAKRQMKSIEDSDFLDWTSTQDLRKKYLLDIPSQFKAAIDPNSDSYQNATSGIEPLNIMAWHKFIRGQQSTNVTTPVTLTPEALLKMHVQPEDKERDSNAELKEGDKAIVSNEQGFIMRYGAELIGHEVEIVKFFNHTNIDLAAVEHDGSIYCFRKSMLEPIKTERQQLFYDAAKIIENAHKEKDRSYGAAQNEITINALIDSGYLTLPIAPSESF